MKWPTSDRGETSQPWLTEKTNVTQEQQQDRADGGRGKRDGASVITKIGKRGDVEREEASGP